MSDFVPVPTPIQLIEFIVRAFVDNPAHVSVTEVSTELVSILYLRVDTADIGKVIGKKGEMARTLEHILRVATVKWDHRFTLLKIIDNLEVDIKQERSETVCV